MADDSDKMTLGKNTDISEGSLDKSYFETSGDGIGRKLRSYYDSVASEPIPEHFLDLLEKLDEVEQTSQSKSTQTKK